MSFKFLDLFSGIGGFRTGLERVGGECHGFAEIDKYARQSYKAMHDTEGEIEWHDITAVTDDDFRDLRGTIDLIAGGFPCQSFSVAGKRMGFDESRGTLFFHIARAAKEIQPRYLFLENVRGLVSHDQGRTLTVILNTIQELGYGHIEWGIFNSKYWGVPQNRERIFIVAELTSEPQRPYLLDLLKDQEVNGVRTCLRDILESEVDEKYYLSEEKTEKILSTLREQDEADVLAVKGDLISRENPKGQYGFSKTDWFTLRCAETHGVALMEKIQEPHVKIAGRINPTGYRQINEVLHVNGISTCLRTFQGGGLQPKIAEPREGRRYRIRKLTPLECWRLQGFSDEQHEAAVAEGLSNSQRYMQAGNSVTVNVIEAIGSELAKRMRQGVTV